MLAEARPSRRTQFDGAFPTIKVQLGECIIASGHGRVQLLFPSLFFAHYAHVASLCNAMHLCNAMLRSRHCMVGAQCEPEQYGLRCLQVQYSQRNLPSNSQRKYVQTVHIPKDFTGEYELTPSFSMELKDVQMLSVSPSGARFVFDNP